MKSIQTIFYFLPSRVLPSRVLPSRILPSRVLPSRILALTIILLSMPLTVAATAADDTASELELDNANWQALGTGFVGRQKVPPKMNVDRLERKLERVQDREDKLALRKQKLQSKLANAEGKKLDRLKTKLARIDNRLANQLARDIKINGRLNRARANAYNLPALWFRTADEGIYTVSLEELRTQWGVDASSKTANQIGKLLKKGKAELRNGGEILPWSYNAATEEFSFFASKYDSRTTDVNAFRLKLSRDGSGKASRKGKKPPRRSGEANSFVDQLHFEEEPDMFFSRSVTKADVDADYWFWASLFTGFRDSISVDLNVPNPAQTGTASLRVNLWGGTNLSVGPDHSVRAELNGVQIGSDVVWDGFKGAELLAEFDQSLFDPAGNNVLTLHTEKLTDKVAIQYLDSIDVEYNRLPVANNDSLDLHQPVAGIQRVTGFSSEDITVWQFSDGVATIRNNIGVFADPAGGFSVDFKAKNGSDYYVISSSATQLDAYVSLDSGAGLADASNAVDYLIIAPRDFASTAQTLLAYRQAEFPSARIVWTDEIYNQFGFGREDTFAYREFVETMRNNWVQAPNVMILLGKGTLDHKDRMGYADSFIPIELAATPWTIAASDDLLLGGDAGLNSIQIGRLPITNDAEGLDYVAKLGRHENQVLTDASYGYRAALIADNPDSAGNFHANVERLTQKMFNELNFEEIIQYIHPDTDVQYYLGQDEAWEAGYLNYDGHGGTTQIGKRKEKFLTATTAAALTNERYSIFSLLTCIAGDFAMPGVRSLASTLVLNPDGGAIASMAPSGLSLDAYAQIMGDVFVEELFGNSSSIGESVRQSKLQTMYSENSGNKFVAPFMHRIYTVLGDPAVKGRY